MTSEFTEVVDYQLRCLLTHLCIRVAAGQSLTVGRSPEVVDVCIPDPNVSRQHLRLGNQGGRLTLEDLNPRQQMILNGKHLPFLQSFELSPGDRLEFSGYCFLVEALPASTVDTRGPA
jgi:predicted component of type VI protein secretion system